VKKVRPELTIESSTQGQCCREREKNEYTFDKSPERKRMGTGEGGPEHTYTYIHTQRSIKATPVNYTTLGEN